MRFAKRRGIRIIIVIAVISLIITGGLLISGAMAEPYAHIAPDYPQINISHILSSKQLTEEDYKILFYQTGLGKSSIDELRTESPDPVNAILDFQKNFFKKINYVCESNSPISREESVVDENGNFTSGTELAPLHNGYILITKSSHVFGWRNGHAAIIVDAGQGEALESAVLGTNSLVQQTDKWKNYPDFMIFRVKETSDELLDEISKAALKNLKNIPYDFTVGILSPKYEKPGEISGTQCSHLVWEAFMLFGFDLDSDSGMIVTPKDIANSPLLEVVQVYGVDPEDIWP
ncbi:MAG: hypothetical protein WCG21_01135 [Eubacteriales bacterium]